MGNPFVLFHVEWIGNLLIPISFNKLKRTFTESIYKQSSR